jgi:plasmid stabilization system protein ParE
MPEALADLVWFRHYYRRTFPQGAAGARTRFRAAESLLERNPYLGRPTHNAHARRLPIARTPFFLLYRLREDRIEVLRVIDSRSFDSLLGD